MKKLIYILLILPIIAFAQDEDPCYSINDYNLLTELNNPQIEINLVSGWNMIGYPCTQEIIVSDAFSSIVDEIYIVKDNNGNVYMPEFGFNGIGLLEGGQGYQIKMNDFVLGFTFCQSIQFPTIEGCTDCEASNFSKLATNDDGSCSYDSDGDGVPDYEEVVGCQDSLACDYDITATDIGECTYAQDGFNCEGMITAAIGSILEGGYLFHIDESGERGLVAALEDLEGAYEWGCYGTNVNGALGQSIGQGYQNTINIVNQGCTAEDEGVTAAQASLDFEFESFSDWYLPSKDELNLMYYNIGNGSSEDNIGGFELFGNPYWSSSEYNEDYGWYVGFNYGSTNDYYKSDFGRVRPIRAFGYTLGCMDEVACNYNSEANMADGSCEYAEQGYDCDGNITAEIGDIMEGGYLFYIDSTGQHGLVAAMEDLTEGATNPNGLGYEWGCYDINVSGAERFEIGGGYQNTLDIVNQGCETENGGITAAQASLNYESEEYDDWFLPSLYELSLLVNSDQVDTVDLEVWNEPFYWVSSEYDSVLSYRTYFSYNVSPPNPPFWNTSSTDNKNSPLRVRPIRAFGNWTKGCMDSLACNYNPEANMADGSCEYAELGYDCEGNITAQIGDVFQGGYLFYLDDSGERGLVAAMDNLGQHVWGCLGEIVTEFYDPCNEVTNTKLHTGLENTLNITSGCLETPIAASEALAYESEGYSDWYLPSIDELELMYNTIGNGAVEEAVCEFVDNYWSSSEATSQWASRYNFIGGYSGVSGFKASMLWVHPIRSFGYTLGCMDETACNYNPEANMADGSCDYPEQGYDCEGNTIPELFDEDEGGIVFYMNESKTGGLVVATEDMGQFVWGCWNNDSDSYNQLSSINNQFIGMGYQNTLDIVSECPETSTAASAALNFEAEGYDDWYLPSQNELIEIYYALAYEVEGNGGFDGSYWSSSDFYNHYEAITIPFWTSAISVHNKNSFNNARAIRSFGNWTLGCMDKTACNFAPEATVNNFDCEYSEPGYDCNGNSSSFQVGDFAEGGIVFYVDETGQHGLVAAMEDLTEGAASSGSSDWVLIGYQWGCHGVNVNGADATEIGSGYQNTLDIVNQGCTTENGSITAAQATLDAQINGYSDWYLPSKDELLEMYKTIGPGATSGPGEYNNIPQGQDQYENLAQFDSSYYISSSENEASGASNYIWSVFFDWTGCSFTFTRLKNTTLKIRPIRSF